MCPTSQVDGEAKGTEECVRGISCCQRLLWSSPARKARSRFRQMSLVMPGGVEVQD